ncbi:uncharacterized protein DMENIID0001_062950 [Sergentomyia squamirostris]
MAEIKEVDVFSEDEDLSRDWAEYEEDAQVDEKNEYILKSCYYCEKDFPNARRRCHHERFCRKDSRRERFTCKTCGLNFRYLQCLQKHEKRHEDPGGFPCDSCQEMFTSLTVRRQHMKIHHQIYRCQLCESKFRDPSQYIKHIVENHSECLCQMKEEERRRRLNCERCGVKFLNRTDLEHHEQSLVCEKIHKCNQCDQSFCFRQSLIVHMTHHPTRSQAKNCGQCGKMFANPERLRKHCERNLCGISLDQVQIKEDKSEIFNGVQQDIREEFKKEFTPDKVLIQTMEEAPDLDDDIPLSQLRLRKPRESKQYFEDSNDFFDAAQSDGDESWTENSGSRRNSRRSKSSDNEPEASREAEYKCDFCPKVYCYPRKLRLHLKVEHDIDSDGDEPVDYSNREDSSRHRGNYSCKFCKKKYANQSSLSRHEKQHGPDGKLLSQCRVCHEYFEDDDSMRAHKKEMHKEKIPCKYCNKSYSGEHNLKTHIGLRHTKTKCLKKCSYLCGKCGKNFTSKTALTDHERSDCGKSPIYQCDVCQKFYHSAGSLKNHKTLHTKIRPFLCKFCGKPYRTPGQMREHERVHTGEKPHKCQYCGKAFSHRGSLLTHLSLHTGFKRFMCSGCGQRFTCISNLQAHRKSHADSCGLVPNCTKAMGRMENYMIPVPDLPDEVTEKSAPVHQ